MRHSPRPAPLDLPSLALLFFLHHRLVPAKPYLLRPCVRSGAAARAERRERERESVCVTVRLRWGCGDEDPVRRVRERGGDGGVLRRRGGAVRALRRRDPRRQQARQQAPAPPARGALGKAPPLRRLPGEGGVHLLRGGPGALLPGLRRAHPRARHALRQPPALPRHRHPRRPRLRLRLQRRLQRGARLRPPSPAQGRHRRAAAARRVRPGAAGALPAAVPDAGLGRRRPPPVLRLRVRRQDAEGVAAGVQGARVVRRHRPLPRPGGAQGRQGAGGGAGALRIPGGERRGVLQAEQGQEGPDRGHRRRGGLPHRPRSWLKERKSARESFVSVPCDCCCILEEFYCVQASASYVVHL